MHDWGKAWQLIVHAIQAFVQYPILLVPLLLAWVVDAAVTLYLKYGWFPIHPDAGIGTDCLAVFLAILAISLATLIACTLVLEMLQHLEDRCPSLGDAVTETFGPDFFRVVALSLVWALIWFALTVIETLLTRRGQSHDDDMSAEDAAKTLAGWGTFSLSRAFFSALEKGVRMIVFLILPAIAWEDLGVVAATKKGFAVLRAHLGMFARGYALTYASAGIIFLPPAILFSLGTGRHGHAPLIVFPAEVWVGVIIYIGAAWSFCMYLEQLFMAQLYLWHMKWDAAQRAAQVAGQPVPAFETIAPPVLLRNLPNFIAQGTEDA